MPSPPSQAGRNPVRNAIAKTERTAESREIFMINGVNRIRFAKLERVKGIEPSFSAWEADVLPLNYTRKMYCFHRFYS